MEQVLNFLSLGWVGSILGMLGLFVAIYQSLNNNKPELKYQCIGQKLINKNKDFLPPNLTVFYDGKVIEQLSLTQIIVWNSGKSSILGSSIVDNLGVGFDFGKDSKILNITIEKTTTDSNLVEAIYDPNTPHKLTYKFKYLEPNDGFLLKILHTAEITYPKSFGNIIGMPKGIIYSKNNEGRSIYLFNRMVRTKWANKLFNLVPFLFGFAFCISTYFGSNDIWLSPPQSMGGKLPNHLAYLLGVLYMGVSIVFIWSERKKYPLILTPNNDK